MTWIATPLIVKQWIRKVYATEFFVGSYISPDFAFVTITGEPFPTHP